MSLEPENIEVDEPIVFDSEEDFQAAIAPPPPQEHEEQIALPQELPAQEVQQPIQRQEEAIVPQQGLDAAGLASAVLGSSGVQEQPAPEQVMDRKSIMANYGPQNNTLPQKREAGIEEIHPADLPAVADVLGKSFMSMSSTGIVLDPMERVMYATSVMENSAMRPDVMAQIVDQAMRDGKIMPEALPKSWYEARGLLLLPPGIDLNAIEGEVQL